MEINSISSNDDGVEIILKLTKDDLHRINGRWNLLSYRPRKLVPEVVATPLHNLRGAIELIGKPFVVKISGDTTVIE